MSTPPRRLRFFGEVLGLHPLPVRARQALVAIRGQQDVPPSQAGLSSLRQLHPRISPRLWAGRTYVPRRVLISNLFNHTQTPIEAGWSVRKTQVRDFRGGTLTYDSHNGTDFAIPVGTPVLAAAPGQVVLVHSEFNRGGLKIYIDHGDGLMTCSAHLARALVRVGDVVQRGQPVALSGYSGLDAALTFPWGIPHVHYNVWLNGEPVDPFPHAGSASLWRDGDLPLPPTDGDDEPFVPSAYDPARVDAAIAACITASARAELQRTEPLWQRAAATIAHMNYYPTRFRERVRPYAQEHPRRGTLSLPFSAESFDGVTFVDEL